MYEAPIPVNNPEQKIFELTSNKGNKFIFTFKNIESNTLFISAVFDDGVVKTFYETEFPLEKIQENKAFSIYDTIDEIIVELFPLIDNGKIHLTEEEGDAINIKFDLPFKKFKNIDFLIKEKKKAKDEKINELYEIVITQNKEITNLKSKLENVEKNFNELKQTVGNLNELLIDLLNENKENFKRKQFENDVITNTRSNIFKSLEEIDFIIDRLKNTQKLKNKKISFNLLFKATRDGQNSSDFHKKCVGKVQQLIFIKTTKGEIFGGYTEEGFYNRDKYYRDNNAFVFSFYKRKIYNIRRDLNAIYDSKSYGPCFAGESESSWIIYVPSKMLADKSNTCESDKSNFNGITSDFEINNGEKYFNIQEIEVYQILYN